MFCPNCGHENADGAKFCAGCGAKLDQAPTPEPIPTPEPTQVPEPVAAPVEPAAPISIEPIFVGGPEPAAAAPEPEPTPAPAPSPIPEPVAPEAPTQVIEPAPAPETQVIPTPVTPTPVPTPEPQPTQAMPVVPQPTQAMPMPAQPVGAPPAPPIPGAPASPMAGGSAPAPKKGPNKTVIAIIGAVVVAAVVIFGLFPKLFGSNQPTNANGSGNGTGVVHGDGPLSLPTTDDSSSEDDNDAKIDAYIADVKMTDVLNQVLYDGKATVVLTGIGEDYEGDTGYLMDVTNNTSDDIYLVCGNYAKANGKTVEPTLYIHVKPGATKTAFMYFDHNEVVIDSSSEVTCKLGIMDKDDDLIESFDFEYAGGGSSTSSTTGTAPQGTVNGEAAGTYYATWRMSAGDTCWTYTVILNSDGTGIFRLGSFDDPSITKSDVDALTYREDFIWTQEGDTVTFYNPEGQTPGLETWPDAPQSYKLEGSNGSRKLVQAEPDIYHYPAEDFTESFDEALAGIDGQSQIK